ncbi:transposase [Bradyrhizobium sp. CCBAU 11386]|uniref:transposase n=1 Tax=Bradyrhizobium sp. CCBAU 11386 TaxID=1630837 RepID=UPI003FA4B778
MRYELTDEEWAAIKPMLPNKPRGVPRVNDRRVLNGIFWVLRSGAPWRDLLAGKLLSHLKSVSMLLADRGYDADWIRELAMAWANIPPKRNRIDPICFSPNLYRARNRVERFFNRIKQCRLVATRYDKLAANYLAFVQLASIRLWLAARNESTP